MSTCFYKLSLIWCSVAKTTLVITVWFVFNLTVQAQTSSCTANAGTLDAIDVCLLSDQTILKATPRGDATIPQGFELLYVLTRSSALVIEQVSEEPVFSLPAALNGLYTLHTLVYDPTTLNLNSVVFGQTTGFELNELLVQGGGMICAALDVKGAKARFGNCAETCVASAGKLKASSNNCIKNGTLTLTASVQQAAIVPTGYTRLYVLTSGDDLVIQQVSTSPSFEVNATGRFTIHTLVYDPLTLDLNTIAIGVTTGAAVNALLIQGGGTICGALDVAGAQFNVTNCPPACTAQAAKLKPNSDPCTVYGKTMATATIIQNSIVPQGYQVRYLLSTGYGLLIQQIGTSPSFEIKENGLYTIHTLVYNPATFNLNSIQAGTTTAAMINRQLVTGGGNICGALDMIGATFDLKLCSPPPCHAKPGKLKPDSDACLEYGKAILKAKFLYQPVVPSGYKILYLLATGHDKKIKQVSSSAYFIVNSSGYYSIHALIYDSNTLDVSDIKLGITSIYDIDGWLIQGEGDICGALELTGAEFDVETCVTCTADAGKLKADNEPCLEHYYATIKAKVWEHPTVPSGYKVIYLLAYGNNRVIEQKSTSPSFTVGKEGTFSIHTLVYHPNTFNLNNIYFGVTTLYDVKKWLVQGGGTICGALEVEGATFDIESCQEDACEVDAGRLETARNQHCLNRAPVKLQASHSNYPDFPAGYKVIYLLSTGVNKVVEKTSLNSSFDVNRTGSFRIHTLVYDPSTFNLSYINVGATRVSAIESLLIQGGGIICGALDVQGVSFQVNSQSNCNGYHFNAPGEANIYPNPTTGAVTLTFDKPEKTRSIQVELLNITGKLLKTWNFDGETEQVSLDINELGAGLYNVRIVYDNQLSQNIRVAKTTP